MSRLRLAALSPLLLMLAQCDPPPPPVGQARADAATLSACREHADAVYDRTHRDTIYTINSQNSPFSGGYLPAPVNAGLSDRYGRDNMVRDCVRNTGTETNRSATSTTPPPPTP
ncbi:MAG TPA: hypothetical protein VFL55_15730 [Acetobacteraceae bacterium]|nr:hypothetical protein [Acetobacteraceae bacterium]